MYIFNVVQEWTNLQLQQYDQFNLLTTTLMPEINLNDKVDISHVPEKMKQSIAKTLYKHYNEF